MGLSQSGLSLDEDVPTCDQGGKNLLHQFVLAVEHAENLSADARENLTALRQVRVGRGTGWELARRLGERGRLAP